MANHYHRTVLLCVLCLFLVLTLIAWLVIIPSDTTFADEKAAENTSSLIEDVVENVDEAEGISLIDTDDIDINNNEVIYDGNEALIEIPLDSDSPLSIDDGYDNYVKLTLPPRYS